MVTNIQIKLNPLWHKEPPCIIISFDNEIIYAGHIYQPHTFTVKKKLNPSQHTISVEFINKTNDDTDATGDKAVVIEQITINNITDQKFVWAGQYWPDYPEPWASQQTNLLSVLDHQNYLGWNGKWALTFDVPVFTWIHKTLDLGWIYD